MARAPVLAIVLAASALAAQPSIDLPRLFPAGARAAGIASAQFDAGQNAYLLTLRDIAGTKLVEYRLPLGHPNVQRGLLRIEETTTGIVPIAGGGLFYRTAGVPASGLGRLITPFDLAFSATHDPLHTATILSHSLDAFGTVRLRVRDEYAAGGTTYVTEKTFALRLFGRALQIVADGDPAVRVLADYDYAGFHFGDGAFPAAGGAVVRVPYMDCVPVFRGGGGCVARFLDWFQSNASETPATLPQVVGTTLRGETSSGVYRNDQLQLNAPVHDIAWVIVSPRIADTFPVVDRPPSEYRLLTAARAVSQNAPGNSHAKARDWVLRAAQHGVDDMVHIKWDWHKWPFNLNDPDYIPMQPAPPHGVIWGTVADWQGYANAAAAANWTLAPYFAADMMDPGYPNLLLQLPGSLPGSVLLTPNPVYDASVCTRDAAGNLKKGWDTNANLAGTNLAGQGHPVDVLASHRFAANFASYAAAIQGAGGFPVAGAHIDAQTEIPAWIAIDQIAGSPRPKTIAENLRNREIAFQAAKDAMQGPLLGENSHWRYRQFESFAAGVLDGTSRKFPIHWSPADGPPDAQNWDAEVIPDFELTHIAPQGTAFFGMGWEYHFKGSGYPVPQGWSDAWHTTLLSYGHAPYFSTNGDVTNNYWNWRDTLRSYHLTRGLSAAMRASKITEVRYVDGVGTERDLDAALASGLDLAHPRLVLRFANGLEFKANHSATTWPTTVLGIAYTLPTDGFAGASPSGLLALSAINPASGQRVDYALDPGVVEMIDRRGIAQSFNGFPGALLPVPPGLLPPGTDDKQMTIARDLRRNQAVYANGFLTARNPLGPTPGLVALRVEADDTDTLSLGRLRIGLRAIATDSLGNERDVSGLVQWSSLAPGVATVGRMGAVTARNVGRATIRADLAALSATFLVGVTPRPIIGPLEVEASTAALAMVRFSTDTAAPAAVVIAERIGTGELALVFASPDPAAKQHRAVLTGLASGAQYALTPAAVNAFFLAGIGAPVVITVP
jgi:hypothetical protein